VVDFYADWCGPCKKIAPYVHKKTQEFGLALAKVNVDNAPDVSAEYKIQAMPTFQVLNSKA
jgi:thioredoxin 1